MYCCTNTPNGSNVNSPLAPIISNPTHPMREEVETIQDGGDSGVPEDLSNAINEKGQEQAQKRNKKRKRKGIEQNKEVSRPRVV